MNKNDKMTKMSYNGGGSNSALILEASIECFPCGEHANAGGREVHRDEKTCPARGTPALSCVPQSTVVKRK